MDHPPHNRILDRPCQIHSHPDKPANYTNRNCWVFKQAGKLNAEHNGRRPPGDKDDGAARQPNTRGQKQFLSEVRSLPERKWQFGFRHPPTILARFTPRVHQYALKIPGASAEAQYGQPCKHSRNVFYLFSLLFFIIS